jgi:hypothetical protein
MLVATERTSVYANRFPGKARTLWALYNARPNTALSEYRLCLTTKERPAARSGRTRKNARSQRDPMHSLGGSGFWRDRVT